MNEEHNMTLREKWIEHASFVLDEQYIDTDEVFNWFLSQFDAMLAEDIENINITEEWVYAREILEARRLSLKK